MSHGGSAPPGLAAAGAREVSMTIPVAPEMEIVATAQAAALGEYIAMARDKIDEVKLADCRDEMLHLKFRLGREPKGREWLEVEVLDKGKGFDSSRVEEPTIEKSFVNHRKRGWGLQIIKSLMDEVEITSGGGGTRILMRKYK